MIEWVIRFLTDSPAPLIIAGILYLCQTVAYLRQGEYGMAVAFCAYALANVGFVYDFLRRFN